MLGIDDGYLRSGGDGGLSDGSGLPPVDSGFVYVDGSFVGDSSLGPTLEPDGAPVPKGCDPTVTLDSTNGVFVAPSGSDSNACTETLPCLTVQQGIEQAFNSSSATPPNVYVQAGTYAEQLTLRPGVEVVGGWDPSWNSLCDQTATIIQGTASPTVSDSQTGTATLSTLTVYSQPSQSVSPGETVVGLLATGASTSVSLRYVDMKLASGGNGAPGGVGNPGASPSGPCSPTSAADGGSSLAVGSKGTGADAGWFNATGPYFVALPGSPGGPGGLGENGGPGGRGSCVACVADCTGTVLCSSSDGGQECGSVGTPGCGGGGGLGGAGGNPGGSSVAIIASDATVTLVSCAIDVGNGGNGGPGGGGGTGASGSPGDAGTSSAVCYTTCDVNLSCEPSGNESGNGGPAGGQGGSGALGGVGGDGCGGDSVAIVELGAGRVVQQTGTVIVPGSAGASADGGNGAPGVSENLLTP